MPKIKTNSAASKRVRVTGKGKLMHVGSGMRHNLSTSRPKSAARCPPTRSWLRTRSRR